MSDKKEKRSEMKMKKTLKTGLHSPSEAMKMKKTLKTGIYSPLGAKKMSAKEKAEFKSRFVKAAKASQAMKAEKTVINSPKYKAVKTSKKS